MSSKGANLLTALGVAGIAAYLTGLLLVTHYEKVVADVYKSGYAAGYSAGKASGNLKELALSDKVITSKVCNMWWFGFSHKERVLSRDKDFKDGIGQQP